MLFAIVIAQTVVAVALGAALFKLWRVTARSIPRFAWIVSAGFVFRAFVGQALFWISYLRLPIAPDLQLGDGYWFWGLDGHGFFALAHRFIRAGAAAVLLIDKAAIAYFYVQMIAIAIVLLGASAAVGLLLNSIAFMGMSALIARWEPTREHPAAAVLALAIIWFTPSWLLWSVQPMKDAVFFFFLTAFVFALSRFCRELQPLSRLTTLLGWTAVMMVAVYATAGIRWYFGFLIWGVSCLAVILAFVAGRRFPARPIGVAFAALFLTSQAMVQGSGPYMPEPIQRIFRPLSAVTAVTSAPESIGDSLQRSRETQEKVTGATTFKAPRLIAKLKPKSPRVLRLVIGLSAMFIPPSIGTRAGLINVGGGRGLWLFADLDTIIFDLAIIIALVVSFRRRQHYGPVFWPLMAMTVALTFAIAYVSTNYGTLMRHRAMVLMCVALLLLVRLPLGPAPVIDRDEDDSVHGSDERDDRYAAG